MGMTRRQFLAAGAAVSTVPWLGGCRDYCESEYYRAGLSWGETHRDEIKALLGTFIPEMLGFVNAAEKAGALGGAAKEAAQFREIAAFYGFDSATTVQKSGMNWNMMEVIVQTLLGGGGVGMALRRESPGNHLKLLGIADGSLGPVSRPLYLLLQCAEVTGTIMNWGGACSVLMLRADMTELGEPVYAKNLDLNKSFRGAVAMRRDAPAGKQPVLSMTLTLMPGGLSSTNGRVALAQNTLTGLKVEHRYLPASCVIQDAAETCVTTQEVVDHFGSVHPGGYFVVPVLDGTGDMAVIQNTPAGQVVLRPDDPFVVVTTHPLCEFPEEMQRLMAANLAENTYLRSQRITELVQTRLEGGGKMSLDDVFAVLSNHSPLPGDASVCRHTDTTVTVGSMVMLPASGRTFAVLGSPCENAFVEYSPVTA